MCFLRTLTGSRWQPSGSRRNFGPEGKLVLEDSQEGKIEMPRLSGEFEDRNLSCLGCGRLLNGYINPDRGRQPTVGDMTVCLYCRAWLIFTDTGLRYPTDEEFKELLHHPEFRATTRTVEEMHRQRRF